MICLPTIRAAPILKSVAMASGARTTGKTYRQSCWGLCARPALALVTIASSEKISFGWVWEGGLQTVDEGLSRRFGRDSRLQPIRRDRLERPERRHRSLAERAAWDFIAQDLRGLEPAFVNPTMVLGPALGSDYLHSIRTIKQMQKGQPADLKIKTCVVDFREVADLHLGSWGGTHRYTIERPRSPWAAQAERSRALRLARQVQRRGSRYVVVTMGVGGGMRAAG
jgi:hypothetical protein